MRLISADVLVWPLVEGTKKTLCIVKFRSGAATLLVAARADIVEGKNNVWIRKKYLATSYSLSLQAKYLLVGIFYQAF